VKSSLVIVTLGLSLGACAPFLPPELPPPSKREDGKTLLGGGYLRRKMTVEVEGRLQDGLVLATRIEVEEPDDDLTLKGSVAEISDGGVVVNGVRARMTRDARLLDATGQALAFTDLEVGDWVKLECVERDDAWSFRKLERRQRPEDGTVEIQGVVTFIRHGDGELRIGDAVDVRFDGDVPVLWDVEGEVAPLPQEVGARVVQRGAKGLRRVRRRDDDDRRPDDQLVIGEVLTIGGELQYELEARENHDLRDFRDRDRLIHSFASKLEFSFDLSRHLFAFTQIRFGQDIIHYDERDDPDEDQFDWKMNETYFLLQDLPVEGLAFQAGRQDVDYGREWVVDENLDAARLYVNLDAAVLDLSVSQIIFDPSRAQDGVTNYFAGLYSEALEDQDILTYLLYREGGELVDLSRFHVGVSAEGELADLEYWLDVGAVFGEEDGEDVSGFGFDVAAMYTFESAPLSPYVYAGFAYGSAGDGPDRGDGFRQTGINDNNDKFGGVTSFRYLGELVRPEGSNLTVYTAGVGIRLGEETSLDLLFHHYRQVEPAPFLRNTRLRFAPDGESRDIGNGIDLVVGIEDFEPVEVEVVLSYFHPGAAFGPEATDAWFAAVEIEWNF